MTVLDTVRELLQTYLPFSMNDMKFWCEQHYLGEFWTTVRDYIFNMKMYFAWFLPCFVLERFFAVGTRRAWWKKGVALDYCYPIFNALVVGALTASAVVAVKLFYETHLGFLNTGLLDEQPIWIQGLGAFLITDFAFYVSHFLRHKIPWLWYFHAIHHSQREMNPITPNRAHFFEDIVNVAIRTIPIAFVGGSYPTWFVFTFLNSIWGCFIHSNVKINLGVLGHFIVSPQYHRVHHSLEREHFDMNYGERLTLWDFMFRTLHKDRDVYPETGVKDFPDEIAPGAPKNVFLLWAQQTVYPFVMIGRSLQRHSPFAPKDSTDL